MMFMTSVSAYSWKRHYGYWEKEVLVDVVVKTPKQGLKVWWKNHPMIVREYDAIAYTDAILDLWGVEFIATLPGRNHSFRDYVNELYREMRPIMPYLINGETEFYIVEAGRLPKSYYY